MHITDAQLLIAQRKYVERSKASKSLYARMSWCCQAHKDLVTSAITSSILLKDHSIAQFKDKKISQDEFFEEIVFASGLLSKNTLMMEMINSRKSAEDHPDINTFMVGQA